jgi:TRAP-type mannitol/chloroaromatic compound transport system permease small subunit
MARAPERTTEATEIQANAGVVERLSDLAGLAALAVACVIVVLMMLHVTADVVMKALFNVPVVATLEAVQFYYMVGLVFLPFGYIARDNSHIVVELFTQRLTPRQKVLLEVFTGLLALAWVGLLGLFSIEEAITATRSGEIQETSNGFIIVWPSRWFVPIGCAVMGLAICIRIVRDCRLWLRHEISVRS